MVLVWVSAASNVLTYLQSWCSDFTSKLNRKLMYVEIKFKYRWYGFRSMRLRSEWREQEWRPTARLHSLRSRSTARATAASLRRSFLLQSRAAEVAGLCRCGRVCCGAPEGTAPAAARRGRSLADSAADDPSSHLSPFRNLPCRDLAGCNLDKLKLFKKIDSKSMNS